MPTFSSANPICSRAMVTSPHYLATEAGLAILRKGGNALESAIAIAGVLAVVYSHMCSFGGDAFWLMYADDFVPSNALGLRGLNASGCTGSSVTLGSAGNITSLPHRGYQACLTVPGMVSALEEAFATSRELGGKLGWSELLENALFYASEGFPASSSLVAHSSRYLAQHRSDPLEAPLDTELGKALFPDGKSCALGEIIRQPDLAQSLKQLMDEGPRSFYEGSIAQKIVQDLQLHGTTSIPTMPQEFSPSLYATAIPWPAICRPIHRVWLLLKSSIFSTISMCAVSGMGAATTITFFWKPQNLPLLTVTGFWLILIVRISPCRIFCQKTMVFVRLNA